MTNIGKFGIVKKSRKEMQIYKANMNLNIMRDVVSMTKVDGNVKSRTIDVWPPKSMRDTTMAKSTYQPICLPASSSNALKQTAMSVKDCLISSKNKKNPSLLRSKDDSNEVGYPKKSHALKMKLVMIQSSNGNQNSMPTSLKAMPGLVQMERNINNCSSSRIIGQSSPNQGEVIIGRRDSYDKLEFAKSNHKKDGIVKIMSSNFASPLDGSKFLQQPNRNFGNQCPRIFGADISNHQYDKVSWMVDDNDKILSCKENSELCNRRKLVDSNGETNNGKSKRSRGELMEGKPQTIDDIIEVVAQQENQTCSALKKPRQCLVAIENEVDKVEDSCDNQNPVNVADDVSRSIPQITIWKDSQAKAHVPFYSKQQCSCSKPIDEPAWSGIFKINGKEYVSLAGHLSTKSCEKARTLSKSLPPIVDMRKLSRSMVWPKVWETLKPNDNNIGLYFFSHKIRDGDELDQLVNELIERDLALRAVINEIEMLVFTSVLLPQRYQNFQTKKYLWGVFKPKEDKGLVVIEPLTTTKCHAKEVDNKSQVSNKLYEVNQLGELGKEMSFLYGSMALEKQRWPNKRNQDIETTSVQWPQSKDIEPKAT